MRNQEQVTDYETGTSIKDPEKRRIAVAAYEACVPRDFWWTKDGDITHNRHAFDGDIARYCEKIMLARKRGYGLLLTGANGTGKTIFVSWVLMRAIQAGLTAYYTSMLELDHNLKRGFNSREVSERLEWMLGSDFLAVDELAKEKFKDGDSFARVQLERILKRRFDERLPTLLATNASPKELRDAYGPSVASIIDGKYRMVILDDGDFRDALKTKMESDMYGDGGGHDGGET